MQVRRCFIWCLILRPLSGSISWDVHFYISLSFYALDFLSFMLFQSKCDLASTFHSQYFLKIFPPMSDMPSRYAFHSLGLFPCYISFEEFTCFFIRRRGAARSVSQSQLSCEWYQSGELTVNGWDLNQVLTHTHPFLISQEADTRYTKAKSTKSSKCVYFQHDFFRRWV